MEHKEYKSIHKSVRKKDAMQLLLGKPVFTDDVTPNDALVVKLLRSPHANAIVEMIDTTAAKLVPGVVDVYTWEDVPQTRFAIAGQTYPEPSPYDRLIIDRHVRFAGDVVATLTAAETGHLVFATIHTNSAPQTIDRIVDSFPTDQQNQIRLQLSGVLLGVLSQRLIPRLDGMGRAAAFELMTGTPPILALIRDGKTHQLQSVMETSQKDGMCTLDKSLENLYLQGYISQDQAQAYRADYQQERFFS